MEIISFLNGAEIALQHTFLPLLIEIDSTEVINLLTRSHASMFTSLISNYRYWLRKTQNLVHQHKFREGNKVAHILASQARKSSNNDYFIVFVTPPTMVAHQLAEDLVGHTTTLVIAICSNLAKFGNSNIANVIDI